MSEPASPGSRPKRLSTHDADGTRRLGASLGALLRPGDVVLLRGEMGAGKTTLAQGIGRGLGVAEPLCSPTFNLVQQYEGRVPVFHLDPYRIRTEGDVVDLGWHDLLQAPAVLLVEWPERLSDVLPEQFLEAELVYGRGPEDREITLTACGPRPAELLEALSLDRADPGN